MFKGGTQQGPKFNVKAPKGGLFLPILVEMLQKCFEVQTPHEHLRFHCARALLRCYEEMDSWKPDE